MVEAASFEIVTLKEIHEILSPVVGERLAPQGFQEVATLRWVRSADAPIRQLFTFHQWKGGVISPSWGLSLDFVPHISGSAVKWHRTPKSAMQDLRVDARERSLEMPYHRGAQPLRDLAVPVVSAALAIARPFWDNARCESDLLAAFDRVKRYYANEGGLGFYNFIQHPMALAFVQARAGNMAEALQELANYRPRLDEDQEAVVRQRLEDVAHGRITMQ